ncbi:myb/SANT-like DNA-binding domain-containing protein 4 [Crassostrea angulata]|uniref:myb/SANT-like DNA-binding domain-containing protein 4 n=1 Tax=Magallana angulata TaxID=2784310 RepID=UPI0022B19256|nr:myb/SANT-like DNA-binding domain-containing protein 4 [Crassostrea angulata]XP_052696657.1 myb/SANT-like DNA-binding domain-containing protein 4 [Crassostrea angulata]
MEKKRGQNWGVDEEVALIEEVKARATVLFGSFKGCGIKKGREMKEREWQKIADRLNSQFDIKRREWEEVKKKYYNVKSRSKEKLDGLKRPKTGGGPPLPQLTPGEETYLRLADGEPNLCGVEGGIDTDAPLLSISEPLVPDTEAAAGCSQKADSTLPAIAITAPLEISLDSLQDKQAKPSKRTEKKESASRKRKLEELEEINLTLDNQRLEEEILKIKEEKEVLTLKKEVLLLKKQKLILDIQTTYPSFIAEM